MMTGRASDTRPVSLRYTCTMRQHYEKIICLCCFLSLFVNVGLSSTAFSVFQPYLTALPGVGDTGASLIIATRTFFSIVAMVFVDRYYQLLDARRGVGASMLLTCIGFAIYSQASTLPMLLAGSVCTGIAYGLGGLVAATMLVNRWFASGIGTALGFCTVGSGVAGIVVPVAVAQIVEAQSLSLAFACVAALALAFAVIVIAFVRNRPSDLGLSPYESEVAVRAARGRSVTGMSGKPLSARARFMALLAIALVGAFSMSACAYLAVLLTTNRFDVHFAALAVSIFGISLTAAKFGVGELFDRIGTAKGSAAVFGILFVGLVLCCFVGSIGQAGMLVAAVLTGIGLSLGSVGISVWSLELSDVATRTRSIKNFQLAYMIGGLAMNLVPGPLKQLTGTYATSYVLMLVCGVVAAAIILVVYRRYRTD